MSFTDLVITIEIHQSSEIMATTNGLMILINYYILLPILYLSTTTFLVKKKNLKYLEKKSMIDSG